MYKIVFFLVFINGWANYSLLAQRTPPIPKLPGSGGVQMLSCNTNTSICTPGVAGPFTFAGTNPTSFHQGCLNVVAGNHEYGFILLNITAGGPLNLLVNGSSNSGYIDVEVFNIPNGQDPCAAIQNSSNMIACNYADFNSGCVQFGNAFSCNSRVNAPNVTAGSTLMIVAQDWSNASSSFTLELGPSPGAQTGPPDATISPREPFCLNTTSTILMYANDMGGTWSGPGMSPTGIFSPTVAGVGVHTITYTIGQPPCQSIASEQIEVVLQPTTSFTTSSPCIGGTLEFFPPQPIPADAIYYWSGPNGWTATGSAPTITNVTAAMSGTYSMYVETGGCTSAPYSVNITISNAAPAPTISSNTPVCAGEQIELTTPPSSNTQFFWSGPNGWTSSVASPVIPNADASMAGTYSLYVVSDNTCTSDVSILTVDINSGTSPVINPAGPFCDAAAPYTLTANIPNGVWSGPAVDPVSGVFTPSLAGLGQHTITYTTQAGCGGVGTISLTVAGDLLVTGTVANTSCPSVTDGGVVLNITGNIADYSFVWSNGQTVKDLVDVPAGTYTVDVTNTSGCSGQETFVVGMGSDLSILHTVNDILCYGGRDGSIAISVSGGTFPYTYNVNGNNTQQNPISNLYAGNYAVTVTDSKGCSGSFSADIFEPPPMFADSVVHTIRLGDYVQLNQGVGGGTGVSQVSWWPNFNISCTDCLSPLLWPTITTNYTMTITDGNNCVNESQVLVEVYHDGPFIPNAFTPGIDDINNVWMVSDYGVRTFKVTIYDRWGIRLFQTDNIYEGWDGKRPNGVLYPQGVYVYKIEIGYIDGNVKDLHGHITLVR